MSEKESQNGWSEWSRYVLKELERLNDNIENLGVRMTKYQEAKQTVDSLKEWREKIDATVTIDDLRQVKKGTNEFKTFKTQIITAVVVIQALFGIAITLVMFFN